MVAYGIGAIPTSILVSKLRYGIDIRKHGSGSASHLNIHRIIGGKAALAIRLFDIIKGFAAVVIPVHILGYAIETGSHTHTILWICLGLSAVLGHIFSVFASFQGGKGVHTAIGVLLAIAPIAIVPALGIGLITFFLTRYPNLGYVLGSISVPLFFLLLPNIPTEVRTVLVLFGLILAGILTYSHAGNLRDMIRGVEHKAQEVVGPRLRSD